MPLLRLFVLTFLLLAAEAANAQVLWSITTDDGQRSWLLGTVHSEDPRLLEFPEELMNALDRADRLALELVPDAAMLSILQEAMHFDEGRLDDVLDEELYTAVVEIMENHYGMGEPAVRRMRPWAVAVTISVPPPQTGLFMDLALSFRAAGMGLEVVALETVDEQLDFLRGLPEDGQIDMIRQAVAEQHLLEERLEALISAYLEGDLELLERLSSEQLAEMDPAVMEHFVEFGLRQRNQQMVERALPWLAEGGLIIAVGALHLAGEDGLVKLLEARGFELEGIY